jgi:hypothetical protein
MRKFEIEKVLNQKRPLTHLAVLIFAIIVVSINMRYSSEVLRWDNYLGSILILTAEIESFLLIAYLIFSNLDPGTTPAAITRRVLSRLALFLIACLLAAFIITIGYNYIRQFFTNGDLSEVMNNFFKYSFTKWLKPTLLGLATGALIFIIVLWQDALKREQKLREENLIFQNETLKNQVNPHFLFNSLNTLSYLIDDHPDNSKLFISRLSSIYRYILDNGQKDKVPLKSEMAFISDYFELHKIRDDDKIKLRIDVKDAEKFSILPVSLQILLENAIKHNMATRDMPLRISIFTEEQHIVVRNNLQKMAVQLKSTKIGLRNLAERIRLVTGKPIVVEETASYFTVKVPLLS